MNYNFSFLNGISFNDNYKEKFITNAIAAEKNAKYDPYNSVSAARSALEGFLKGVLEDHGYTKINTLNEMIKKCIEKEFICIDNEANALDVKSSGNIGIHANLSPSMHKVNEENIRIAINSVKSLFEICKNYFNQDIEFDEDIMPFNDYYVIQKVKKAEGEVICGMYNYFVQKKDGNEYYLQCFPLDADIDSLKLVDRSEESRGAIKKTGRRKAYLTPITNDEFCEGSDRRYVIYDIGENGFLLSQLKKKLSPKKALYIGLDLIGCLMEMKNAQIHHRNINPGCIVVWRDKDSKLYQATLVNMQSSKISNSDGTVIFQLTNKQQNNHFIPADIRNALAEDLINISWEKVDVYSVAKSVAYCINPELVNSNCKANEIIAELESFDCFSDDFLTFFDNILKNDTANNPSLEEMKEKFENEFKHLGGEI